MAITYDKAKVQSVYRWQGELCQEEETTLLIKVSGERVHQTMNFLTSIHPYEVPEIISLPLDPKGSLPAYLKWIEEQCRLS